MTVKQIRMRNWQKARIMGFIMNTDVLTSQEIAIYSQMLNLKVKFIDNWDENTELLIGHPLPPYKCEWCGKRSDKEYIVEGVLGIQNLCKKDYERVINEKS